MNRRTTISAASRNTLLAMLLVGAAGSAAHAQWSTSGSIVYYNGGKVGVGTAAPFGIFHVSGTTNGVGNLRSDNAGTGPSIFGYSTAAAGFNYGLLGSVVSPDGRGVWGIGSATTGDSIGVRGTSYSATGYGGVFDGGQYGLYSQSASPGGATVGVWGQVSSPDGWGGVFKGGRYGVWGEANGAGRFAGYFIGTTYVSTKLGIGTTSPEEALQVVGNIRMGASSTIGGAIVNGNFGSLTIQAPGNGSSFEQATSGGYLRLFAGSSNLSHGGTPPPTGTSGGNDVIIAAGDNVFVGTGSDVWNGNIIFNAGDALGNGGAQPERLRIVGDNGFVGVGTSSPGNRLTVRTGSESYGIEHTDGTTRLGTYVGAAGGYLGTITNHELRFFTNDGASALRVTTAGNVEVVNTLSKGGGSFKIDHPLDPANKYLYHSFVESPDMMNIYNGSVVTDEKGYAVVMLPEWFEALNRDFRYQLTVVDEGEGAWTLARVVRKIEGNQFTIQTSTPQAEVSWQVTGIRHDAFANAHRIPTEVAKPEELKGTYLHAAAFGLPEELAEGYRPSAAGEAPPRGPVKQPLPAARKPAPAPVRTDTPPAPTVVREAPPVGTSGN